jgi:hypothetical protein
MTQTLYAHMNKIKKLKINKYFIAALRKPKEKKRHSMVIFFLKEQNHVLHLPIFMVYAHYSLTI